MRTRRASQEYQAGLVEKELRILHWETYHTVPSSDELRRLID